MYDIEAFIRDYPEWFNMPVTLEGTIRMLFIFTLPFLIPYLYIRFFESRVASFVRERLAPFIMIRLHLEKLIVFIKKLLEIKILPKARI